MNPIKERDQLFEQCERMASRAFHFARITDLEHGLLIAATIRHRGKVYELSEVFDQKLALSQEIRILRSCRDFLERNL